MSMDLEKLSEEVLQLKQEKLRQQKLLYGQPVLLMHMKHYCGALLHEKQNIHSIIRT